MNILGIESSCDETAVAVVKDGREILSSYIASQVDTHTLYGGVVPEIAARAHCEAITGLAKQAIADVGLENIDAIAVTYAPGLIGALLVGVSFAKSLALATGKPLIPVHHLRGHVASDYLTHNDLKPPFTALIASGGHSHIVYVKDYTDYEIMGTTKDDAAGECFDKAARVIGLGYPGGVKIEKLARNGNPDAIRFPRVNFPDEPYCFSFSGIKTAIINYVHNKEQLGEEYSKEDVAASFTEAVVDVLAGKAVEAAKHHTPKKLAVAGGVSANGFLRERLISLCEKNNVELYLPDRSLCGDNAAMIAAQGYYEYLAGNVTDESLNATPTANICKG